MNAVKAGLIAAALLFVANVVTNQAQTTETPYGNFQISAAGERSAWVVNTRNGTVRFCVADRQAFLITTASELDVFHGELAVCTDAEEFDDH